MDYQSKIQEMEKQVEQFNQNTIYLRGKIDMLREMQEEEDKIIEDTQDEQEKNIKNGDDE